MVLVTQQVTWYQSGFANGEWSALSSVLWVFGWFSLEFLFKVSNFMNKITCTACICFLVVFICDCEPCIHMTKLYLVPWLVIWRHFLRECQLLNSSIFSLFLLHKDTIAIQDFDLELYLHVLHETFICKGFSETKSALVH